MMDYLLSGMKMDTKNWIYLKDGKSNGLTTVWYENGKRVKLITRMGDMMDYGHFDVVDREKKELARMGSQMDYGQTGMKMEN